jgi:CII-binding regulator of phage lambda lysogenization HflD
MVQGKTLSYNHKVHRREVLAEDKWDIVENTHEAIISKADFEKVQALLNGKTKSTKSLFNTKPSIFAGVLVCSDCGKKMVRSTSKSNGVVYNKFICSTYKKHGVEVCSCHLIQEEALEEIVKEALNKLVFDIVDLDKRLKKATEKEKSKNIIILEKSKKVYEKQSKDIMSLKMELYKDYKLGNITLDEFQDMKAGFYKKYNQSEQNLNSIENQILSLNSKNYIDEKMMERIRPYLDGIHQLTRKMVIDFIDEILVDNDKNIRMKFKFIDELKNIVLFLNNK